MAIILSIFTQTDLKSGAVVAETEPQTVSVKDICLKFVKNYLESTLFKNMNQTTGQILIKLF